jgi:hypothetical protein
MIIVSFFVVPDDDDDDDDDDDFAQLFILGTTRNHTISQGSAPTHTVVVSQKMRNRPTPKWTID